MMEKGMADNFWFPDMFLEYDILRLNCLKQFHSWTRCKKNTTNASLSLFSSHDQLHRNTATPKLLLNKFCKLLFTQRTSFIDSNSHDSITKRRVICLNHALSKPIGSLLRLLPQLISQYYQVALIDFSDSAHVFWKSHLLIDTPPPHLPVSIGLSPPLFLLLLFPSHPCRLSLCHISTTALIPRLLFPSL